MRLTPIPDNDGQVLRFYFERGLEHQPVAAPPRTKSHTDVPRQVAQPEIGGRVIFIFLPRLFEHAVILQSPPEHPSPIQPSPQPRPKIPFMLPARAGAL